MRNVNLITVSFLLISLIACQTMDNQKLIVANNTNVSISDALVQVPLADLERILPGFDQNTLKLMNEDEEIAFQVEDTDQDGNADLLVFVTSLKPGENLALTPVIDQSGQERKPFLKRTQAELSHKKGGYFKDKKYIDGQFENVSFSRVPAEHTDHDTYYRYEGPGWESDLVGYRFYLDWRNATDIFGKKTRNMVLQDVGQDGFDSYHEMSDWGMDVLKVGPSLGIGSIGTWYNEKVYMVSKTDSITCEISVNGPVRSMIRTDYFGWDVEGNKSDLVSQISIAAGDRKTKHDVQVKGTAENLCTGLVRHPLAEVIESKTDGEWQYLANYGKQSLAGEDDLLGMAILYRKSDLQLRTDDENSHILVLNPEKGNLSYYFLAAWGQEPNGIGNLDQFRSYLEEELVKLNSPVTVQVGI